MNSTGGRRLRWRYPEANHGRWCRDGSAELHGPGVPQGGVKQPTAGV
jgi:hypothetical protein